VPYPRGELIRLELYRYFLGRHAGDLNPRLSMLEAALNPRKKLPPPPRPAHPLCPEVVTLEVNLAQYVGFMADQVHTAAAVFEALPAWLRFLESRGLIDGARHAKSLEEMRPLHAKMLEMTASYSMDPTLHRNLQAWPAHAPSGALAGVAVGGVQA
jgi:hypothetical protein